MFGRLLPRETSFFDFFEKHGEITVLGAKEFLSLATTGANVAAKAARIKEIDHECDTITHRCVRRSPSPPRPPCRSAASISRVT
jgi:uncharacterized protein Yka (UPF0111/DUF47 family)